MSESKREGPARAAELAARGRHDEAVAIYDALLQDEPSRPELHFNRAVLLYQSGAPGPAEQAFLRAGALRPQWTAPLLALGQLYSDARRYEEAERCYRIAVSLQPELGAAHCNLGVTLMRLARTVEALPSLRRARELLPADEAIWLLFRNALIECGRDEEALEDFLRFEPQAALSAKGIGVGFAVARMMPGDAFEQKYLRLALEWPYAEADTQVLASVVAGLQYYDVAPQDLLRIYRSYDDLMQARRGGNPDLAQWDPVPARGDAPLRVGYLSADFRNHVMGWIMLGVISRHDRRRVEPYAYSIAPSKHEDAMTQAFCDQAAGFVRLADRDDRAAAQRIAEDRLDVLVDLMSHSAGARPGILVHKPAPVIVEHLGLHGAIGLRQADYKITDDVADLPDAGRFQIERPLTMRGSVIPIRPVAGTALRTDPPPRPDGATIVFAAFASLAKLSPRCLDTWRRILDTVAGAVLLFSPYVEWERKFYVRRAASFGIDESRLRFVPAVQSEPVDRARYRIVDIALDAFPYTGGDSAAAALAEGVPLVTLCGRRHAERVATSILRHLGIADGIAQSEDEYVAIAVALAQDSARRRALSERIRAAVPPDAASAMEAYTRNIEDALESAVRQRSGAAK
jgi:predicted O-linked N-acetylglucosamine transferase (SPINDLY family)